MLSYDYLVSCDSHGSRSHFLYSLLNVLNVYVLSYIVLCFHDVRKESRFQGFFAYIR